MEFLKNNLVDTTTSIVVGSGTLSVANILDWDKTFQYVTQDFDNDLTTASMVFSFDETTTLNRIAMMELNVKSFTMFYNGVTANTFSFTSSIPTSASDFSTNSETSMFFRFTDVDVTSVTFDLKKTMTADSEKAIGFVLFSELKKELDRTPSAKNYNPIITPKQVVHKLSNGGVRIHTTGDKFSAKIKYENIETTFRNDLKSIYDEYESFVFAPFATATSWDEIIHEVVWPGKFNFFKYSDNAVQAGHSGTIDLRETS